MCSRAVIRLGRETRAVDDCFGHRRLRRVSRMLSVAGELLMQRVAYTTQTAQCLGDRLRRCTWRGLMSTVFVAPLSNLRSSDKPHPLQ